jgi:four helix bundle protein
MYSSFEELEVWKRACNLAVEIYRALRDTRDYGLKDQMQRAAVSIASNIAEGSERSVKDFQRFLSIARGSAAELRTQAYIAFKIDAMTAEVMRHVVDECKGIGKMLFALGKSLGGDPP